MAEQAAHVTHVSKGARVLVCGASFAGLATAYWMDRLGFHVTIVEIAAELRRGGTPVDIKEGTVDVVRRMGLLDAIRSRSLPPRRTEFKNADDVLEAVLPARPVVHDGPDEGYEIDRDELLQILHDAIASNVDMVFDQSVVRLEEDADGVTASFADGSRQTFALVFGCDGARSNTRRLVFGHEEECVHFLRHYSFLKVVPKTLIERDVTQIFSAPGTTVMLNGYVDKTDIAFGFHSDHEIPYDHRDKAQQKRLIRERFEGLGWRTKDLLDEVDGDGDFYFDRICQMRMRSWSKGRVALVGDVETRRPAPQRPRSPSIPPCRRRATGSNRRRGGDFAAAFQDYDDSLRPFVDKVQDEAVSFGQAMFCPATQAAINERNRMFSEMSRSPRRHLRHSRRHK